MSRRDRHDGDRRNDRRDSQPEDEQQRRSGEIDLQESDSLTALKAILSKVAALLNPLQLTQDESIRLVEQLYGSVLETDVRLAGEADDTRKSSILAYIQNTSVTREGGKIVVQHQANKEERVAQEPPKEPAGETAPRDTVPAAPATPSAVPREATPSAAPNQQPAADAPKPAPPAKERAARPAKPRSATSTRSTASRTSAARATEAAAADATAADAMAADPPVDPPEEAPTAAE